MGGISMKAVITVIGTDRIGIIASITGVLAKAGVNILDISQTIMQSIFSMIMLVDLSNMSCEFTELSDLLKQTGEELGVEIRFQREETFTSMHRI
jgi:ACT domain-containing protein